MEQTNNTPTILDYLNEDCWRPVLQYVPVKDIIRSERVSRRWQRVVLEYLQTIPIGIDFNTCYYNHGPSKVQWLQLEDNVHSFTKKLGASVVAACCESKNYFKVIRENCPNLKELKVAYMENEELTCNENENFRMLQRVCFMDCDISDDCASQFIASDALEELIVKRCNYITGECLINLKSTIFKSFKYCQGTNPLQICHLLSAADRLGGLTRLQLEIFDDELCDNIYLLLGKWPHLEYLNVDDIYMCNVTCDNFFKAVCGLNRLKHLRTNFVATDESLIVDVTRLCQELHTLNLECPYLTGRGLAAVSAHAGARLVSLGLRNDDRLTDHDVAACIRACPNLKSLDVSYSCSLTKEVAALALAARRGLRARGTGGKLRLILTGCDFVDEYRDQWPTYAELEDLYPRTTEVELLLG